MMCLLLVLYLVTFIQSRKLMTHHFTGVNFALDNYALVGRYAVHKGQQIHLEMKMKTRNQLFRLKEEEGVQFNIDIYYSKNKYRELFHSQNKQKNKKTCEERREYADYKIKIKQGAIEEEAVFKLQIDERWVAMPQSESSYMYIVISECTDKFFPLYHEQLTENQYDVEVQINKHHKGHEQAIHGEDRWGVIVSLMNLIITITLYKYSFYSGYMILDRNTKWLRIAGITYILGGILLFTQQMNMTDHSHDIIYGFFGGLLSIIPRICYQLMFIYLAWGQGVTHPTLQNMDCINQLLALPIMIQIITYILDNNILILAYQDHHLHYSYTHLITTPINLICLVMVLFGFRKQLVYFKREGIVMFYRQMTIGVVLYLAGDIVIFYVIEHFHELDQKITYIVIKMVIDWIVYLIMITVFKKNGSYSNARLKYRMPSRKE